MTKRTKRYKTNKRSDTYKRSEASQKIERSENPARSESPKRAERFETPAEPEKLTKLDKTENFEESHELHKPETVANPEVLDKSEKLDKPQKPDEPETPSRPCTLETVHEEEEIIKHPLEYSWGMWYITNDKRNWEDNLVKLTSFDTVEDYWRLYHHMKLPSQLGSGRDYAVFKNEYRPMWEDPANRSGGRWVISFDKKRTEELDSIWMYLVLLMIGENFAVPSAICGAVVNVRARSRVALWVADYKNEHDIIVTGKKIRDTLGLGGRLSFQQHNTTKSLYTM
ncbi:eukaryotic translation initiation factor 4E-1B-like isoform X2 [Pararge aegeria]|nr:eukaryotic translation initiation factor 4E-1B-like isoform X2 [Pararge aegeria]XP_039749077.1 eukaryotic translation initiation factor 4E-1B-like isoform X2 [Pararge aegeria]